MTHNDIAYYEALQSEAKNLESARHNREVEANERRAQDISKAYNDYYLQIASFREKEQQRHNMASERLSSMNNYLTQLQIRNEERRLSETERHNKSLEYSDLLGKLMSNSREEERNKETRRHNEAMEKQQSSEFDWSKKVDSFNSGVKAFDSGFRAIGTIFNGLDTISKLFSISK